MRDEAQALRALGFSSGIVDMTGTPPRKYPTGVKWRDRLPAIKNWPKYGKEGVCIFTGEIEIIDVDSKHWREEGDFSQIFMEWVKILPFSDKLVCYKTINNGLQYPYRTQKAGGNNKLAIRLTGKEAIIETRGKSGLAVCPPTEGYSWLNADWEDIPILTDDERDDFVNACRDWNQGAEISSEIEKEHREYKENTGKPGDDWACKNDFIDFILDHGWAVDKIIDGCVLLRRPGKDSGCSASWNYKGLKRFYVWSSSTALPTEKLLKPFAVKAYLEYDGDFKACAMALKEQGYGDETLALVEACEHCSNWGEVGLTLQEHKEQVIGADWTKLSLSLQSIGIPGVSESKLEKLKKSIQALAIPAKWEETLTYDEDGKVKGKLYNLETIFVNAEKFQNVFFFDDFNQRIVIFNKQTNEIVDFDDNYMALLRVKLARDYGDFRERDIEHVVITIAKRNHFHPLQTRIKEIEWDERPRVDTWLSKYCGAEDIEYTRLVGKKWLISAIARLFKPGCKVDNVMMLEGGQGSKKSTMLRELSYDNFLDGGIDIRSKDGLMSLFGKWIVEFSELEGLNGRTADTVKAFLAKQDDKIRLPYKKTEEYFKRTCVFAGTTNRKQYLSDTSGNRRFWPIKIDKVDMSKIIDNRDQLWAEAYQMYRRGEIWWTDEDAPESLMFAAEQDERIDGSDIDDTISDYLTDEVLIFDDGIKFIKLVDIWTRALNGKLENLSRSKELEIASSLRRLGFEKGRKTHKGVKYKGWLSKGGHA